MVVDFDPVILSLGPLQIRWYGLMYVVGFYIAGFLAKKLVKEGFIETKEENVDSLVFYMIIGMFIGARLTYVFVYNWDYYSQHLNELFAVWKGGLSFHGAIIGLLTGGWVFSKRFNVPLRQICDTAVTAGCQGVFFGRIGNFINGELYGRVTDSHFGLIFKSGGPYPRHPSQLYEGIAEGIILFSILWFMRKRVKSYGEQTVIFLCGYAFFRYFIEFAREADAQLGYYLGGTTTMGQILCFIMFLCGFSWWVYVRKNPMPIKVNSK